MSIDGSTPVDIEILLKLEFIFSLEMSIFLTFLPGILLKAAQLIPI